jgi:hypothetical protein
MAFILTFRRVPSRHRSIPPAIQQRPTGILSRDPARTRRTDKGCLSAALQTEPGGLSVWWPTDVDHEP